MPLDASALFANLLDGGEMMVEGRAEAKVVTKNDAIVRVSVSMLDLNKHALRYSGVTRAFQSRLAGASRHMAAYLYLQPGRSASIYCPTIARYERQR